MFPSPLEFKWVLVQTPIARFSEDTLGLSLLSVSSGSVFLQQHYSPSTQGFFSFSPTLSPQFLHPEISLIHAICKQVLSKEENHGGDDAPGQNDLKRILTFLNLKIPGPFFLMANSSHTYSIQVVLGPSWGHCWPIQHFSEHFFKKGSPSSAALAIFSTTTESGPDFSIGFPSSCFSPQLSLTYWSSIPQILIHFLQSRLALSLQAPGHPSYSQRFHLHN